MTAVTATDPIDRALQVILTRAFTRPFLFETTDPSAALDGPSVTITSQENVLQKSLKDGRVGRVEPL